MHESKRRNAVEKGSRDSARRRFVLLASSVLAHALILILLPGLARPAMSPSRLFVKIVEPRHGGAAYLGPGSPGVPGFDSAAGSEAGAAGEQGDSGARQQDGSGDDRTRGYDGAAKQQRPTAQQQPGDNSPAAAQPASERCGNDATSVVKSQSASSGGQPENKPATNKPSGKSPQKPEIKPATSKPAGKPPAKPEEKPATTKPSGKPPAKPADKPADKPAEGSGGQGSDATDVETGKPAEGSGPGVNKPQGDAPKKPGGSGGSGGDSPNAGGSGGSGSGSGDDSSGGGNGAEGDGGGPVVGVPAEPPGPSQRELDLLADYGNAALKRIKGQARNPESGGEGTVVFEFEVARDGSLVEVSLVDDSGHELLGNDVLEAARAAFNEAHEKIPFPREVKVKRWTFRKSIKYPLY
jgi:TonB family protein